MGSKGLLKNKYILLAVLLIAVFALPGCRTRITNNSEVSNVYMDEDGFLTETYQSRRDELGLSTAERPILPDLGSSDDTEDFDTSEETNFNYAPEEDTYVEPPTTNTTTNTTTTTNRGTSTSTGTRSGTTVRRRSSSSSDDDDEDKVTITINPGKKGAIEGKKAGEKIAEEFEKNASFTLLEADYVVWKGHKLVGWKPSDGTEQVAPGKKVKAKKDITYTAVWEESNSNTNKENNNNKGNSNNTNNNNNSNNNSNNNNNNNSNPVKKPKVTFYDSDGNIIGSPVEVENGKPKNTPTPSREGYDFAGWSPSIENITEDTEVHPKWNINPQNYWSVNKPTINGDKTRCYVEGGDDSIVIDCNGDSVSEGDIALYIGFVKLVASEKDVKETADIIRRKFPGAADEKILIVSYAPKDDKAELLYKLYLHEKIYPSINLDDKISEVKKETELKQDEVIKFFSAPPKEDSGGEEEGSGDSSGE